MILWKTKGKKGETEREGAHPMIFARHREREREDREQ